MKEMGKYGASRVNAAFKMGEDFSYQSPTRLEMETGGKKTGVVMQIITDGASLIVIDERSKWAFPGESGWYIKDARSNIAQQMYDKAAYFESKFFPGHLDIPEAIVTMGDCKAAIQRAKDKADELVAQDERYLTDKKKAKLKKEILGSILNEQCLWIHSRFEDGRNVRNFVNAKRIIYVMNVFGVEAMMISTTPKDASVFRLEPVYKSIGERHSEPLAVAYIAGFDIRQDNWTSCSEIGAHIVEDNVQEPKGFFESKPKKAMSANAAHEKSRTDAMKQLVREYDCASPANPACYAYTKNGRQWSGTPFAIVLMNGEANRIRGMKSLLSDNDPCTRSWEKMSDFLTKMLSEYNLSETGEEYESHMFTIDELLAFEGFEEHWDDDRIETEDFSLNTHTLKLLFKALGVKTSARVVSKRGDKYGKPAMIFKCSEDCTDADDFQSVAFFAQMCKPND